MRFLIFFFHVRRDIWYGSYVWLSVCGCEWVDGMREARKRQTLSSRKYATKTEKPKTHTHTEPNSIVTYNLPELHIRDREEKSNKINLFKGTRKKKIYAFGWQFPKCWHPLILTIEKRGEGQKTWFDCFSLSFSFSFSSRVSISIFLFFVLFVFLFGFFRLLPTKPNVTFRFYFNLQCEQKHTQVPGYPGPGRASTNLILNSIKHVRSWLTVTTTTGYPHKPLCPPPTTQSTKTTRNPTTYHSRWKTTVVN